MAPGGKTDIFYDPPENRGRPGKLAGPELMDPAKTISLDDFTGKVVVINVWGQWCGPCRTEITQLQKVYDKTRASVLNSLASTFATTTVTLQKISSSTARSRSRRSTTRRCAP